MHRLLLPYSGFAKKVAAHTNGLEAIRMAVMAGVDKGVYYVPTYSTWFKNYPLNLVT